MTKQKIEKLINEDYNKQIEIFKFLGYEITDINDTYEKSKSITLVKNDHYIGLVVTITDVCGELWIISSNQKENKIIKTYER